MKDLYRPIVRFLSKESKGALQRPESADQCYVIRLVLLALAAYYLITSAFIIHLSGPVESLTSFVGFFVIALLFFVSYQLNSEMMVFITIAVPVLINTFLSVEWGFNCDFQYIIPMGIAIAFGSVVFSLHVKFLVSALLCIYSFILNIALFYSKPIFIPYTVLLRSLKIANTLFIAIYLIIVSYYFCIKFTEAEHKVYIYNRQLKKMASLDPLTNLMNRRGMSETLPDMQREYMEGLHGLSIAIGDIDFFKKVNDNYGHDCGDYILTTVSDIFSKYMEGKGEVCRWGGEEFLFVFTEHNPDNVFVYLNDLRHTIKHTRFTFNDININVTMTFGLEEFSPNHGIDATIKAADEKLYLGKESGRDKVVY